MDIKSARLTSPRSSDALYFYLMALSALFTWSVPTAISAEPSTCYGTTKHGRVDAAVKLPIDGKNFSAYSVLAVNLGRTYVHNQVRDVIVAAYQQLSITMPNTRYVYGETGLKNGGPFPPHKTHQNGLSVDFMVPVLDNEHRSVDLPGGPLNKYGYDIEFDKMGRYNNLRIDFNALAAHLVALHQQAKRHHIGIWRVLFDPALQAQLLATEHGSYIKQHIQLAKKPSWVRHDEHYHVDFMLPCKNLSQHK